MGCRWTPANPVEMNRFSAVEVVNGGSENPAQLGLLFWEEQLNLGHRLTAIGGSDNHQPTLPLDATNSVGHPTTIVYAAELSTPAILDGIRAGRVFIDVNGSHDRMLDLSAHTPTSSAVMGGLLVAQAGQPIEIEAQISGCQNDSAELIESPGQTSASTPQKIVNDNASLRWTVTTKPARSWFFVEIRDSSGQLLLVSNPIYVNWSSFEGLQKP